MDISQNKGAVRSSRAAPGFGTTAFLDRLLKVAEPAAPRLEALLNVTGLRHRSGRMHASDPSASRLNASGAPMQLCVTRPTLGTDDGMSGDLRLLIDPFFQLPATARIAKSRQFSRELADLHGYIDWFDALDPFAALPGVGAIWLAIPITHRGRALRDPLAAGAAVYVNPETFGDAPWPETLVRLQRLMPQNRSLEALLDKAARETAVVCLALEFAAGRAPRIKLYLRASQQGLRGVLSHLPAHLLPAGALPVITPTGPWPVTGVTMGLSIDSATGDIDGLKLDLCLCEKCRATAGLGDGLWPQVAAKFPQIETMRDTARLALLGFAQGGKGARMNVYLEPC